MSNEVDVGVGLEIVGDCLGGSVTACVSLKGEMGISRDVGVKIPNVRESLLSSNPDLCSMLCASKFSD